MEYEVRGDAIGIDASEHGRLAFGDAYDAEYEYEEQKYNSRRANQAFFFAYCAEYKVGVLLRHIFKLGLCAVEEPFPENAAGTYGYL